MIDSRSLSDLNPKVRALAELFLVKCGDAGIKVCITQTLRDKEFQDKLYAKGRTTSGSIVTNAKGGSSYHNYGLAFDFVPLNAAGKPDWNSKHWQTCGKIGKALGLEWGGDFTKLKDMPHFQYTFGLSIADLKAGKRPKTA